MENIDQTNKESKNDILRLLNNMDINQLKEFILNNISNDKIIEKFGCFQNSIFKNFFSKKLQ